MSKTFLTRWALYSEGSHVANASEYTPPALGITEAEFRAGHMDMPLVLDDGMEAMSVTIKLVGADERILSLFGFQSGGNPRFVVREGYVSGKSKNLLEDKMEGLITRYESDARTETDRAKSGVTITLRPSLYSRTIDGKEVIYIDAINGVRRINGVDQFKEITDFVMGKNL
ncbi:phage major tail tube protein [Buttiauxella ferragutiae]|uniref:phage major tail tube protein n=1 Tax=Buttiauxella ferragutiae TaxID=82989 RepID=UPI001F53CDF4|nr:phage major tail tube protein [Buttiauxella ferragutiae]UNK59740.1 phage major tail tube protein [Buttiauxella ferragutiae]